MVLRDPAQPMETKRHAAYYLAQTHEYRDEWEEMAAMLQFSGVTPGRDDDAYDWLAHNGWAHVFRQNQLKAIERGIPPIYLNALPQSGSSFLTAFVTSALGIERCRTSKGPYPEARIVPNWLATFARGGATTHEHFCASPEHIAALEASGISKLNIHVRHPVAAALSAIHLRHSQDISRWELFLRRSKLDCAAADFRSADFPSHRVAAVLLGHHAQFMDSWMRYSLRPDARIAIRFTRYKDEFDDPAAFFDGLMSFFLGDRHNVDVERVFFTLLAESVSKGGGNFQGRYSNRFVDNIDAATRDVAASILKPDLMKFYGY